MFKNEQGSGVPNQSVLPIALGGHGASSLSKGLDNLKFARRGRANLPGNHAILTGYATVSETLIPEGIDIIPSVSLDGGNSVLVGETVSFTITNFDAFTEYNLGAIGGKASRNVDVISFTAGNAPGSGKLIVNGTVFDILIAGGSVEGVPDTPILVSPFPGSYNTDNALTFMASNYVEIGGSAHASTDWELSKKPDFSAIEVSSYADTVNKTQWKLTGLNYNAKYYLRVRYRSANGVAGSWSESYWFITGGDFRQAEKVFYPESAELDYYGRSLAISKDGNFALVGAPLDSTSSVNQGVVYVYQKQDDRWIYKRKLYAPDGIDDDRFGTSVSLNSDGTVAAIGAQYHAPNSGLTKNGTVYIWTRSGDSWSFRDSVSGEDGSDYLGSSVSLNSTGTIMAVGALGVDGPSNQNNYTGAVYIFSIDQTTYAINQLAVLYDPNMDGTSSYGYGVSLSGDGSKLLVSSITRTVNGVKSGNVSYFTHSGSDFGAGWAYQSSFIPFDPIENHRFGTALAISDNGNYAWVGAYGDKDVGYDYAGAIYLFSRSGSTWTQSQKIVASDAETTRGDNFGNAIALNGAIDYMLVGAPRAYGNKEEQGCFYVFKKQTYVPDQEKVKLSALDGGDNEFFGYALDINDAYSVVAVGANQEGYSKTATMDGAVYIFNRAGDVWSQNTKLTSFDRTPWDRFGASLSLNANGDFLVVGAPADDYLYNRSGSVYTFKKVSNSWQPIDKITAPVPEEEGEFGISLSYTGTASDGYLAIGSQKSGGGDYTGTGKVFVYRNDGLSLQHIGTLSSPESQPLDWFGGSVRSCVVGSELFVFIGAQSEGSGFIYIFRYNGTTWTRQAKLQPSSSVSFSNFGKAFDVNSTGDMLLVSAPGYNGKVFCFRKVNGIWNSVEDQVITPAESKSGDLFGWDLRLNNTGDTMIVGCPSDDLNGTDVGSAYIYKLINGVWLRKAKLVPRDGKASDHFGFKVALAGNSAMAVVSAYNSDPVGVDSGAVYVYGY